MEFLNPIFWQQTIQENHFNHLYFQNQILSQYFLYHSQPYLFKLSEQYRFYNDYFLFSLFQIWRSYLRGFFKSDWFSLRSNLNRSIKIHYWRLVESVGTFFPRHFLVSKFLAAEIDSSIESSFASDECCILNLA